MGERVTTGIVGLDKALRGGIPKGNLVLLSGGAGTGKTTFCLQYLLAGVSSGEKGFYITTEQKEFELEKQAASYGWNIKKFVQEGLLEINYLDILSEDSIIANIKETIKRFSPSRIVLDSMSTFSEYAAVTDFAKELLLKRGGVAVRSIDEIPPRQLSEKTIIRRMLASLLGELKSFNATILLTSELPEKGSRLSSDGISEFLSDGVVILKHLGVGSTDLMSLQIVKMRYTPHKRESLFYEFSDKGLVLGESETNL